MQLTGRCKEEFEKWLDDNYNAYEFYNCMGWFEHIPSMQYGVYVDFFDSVGYELEIFKTDELDFNVFVSVGKAIGESGFLVSTRQEARTKAIEKANEIYNND